MAKTYKKIPIPKRPEKSLIAPKNDLSNYDRIVFDFKYFQTHSIAINGFNNLYKSKLDSVNAVGDFFETLQNINLFTKKEFFVTSRIKQFHYNEFTDEDIIDRIEKVLIEGYKMPHDKVREFERMYFEFSFNDGKRVIGTKIYDNIFSILFLDPNHLICENSSRNVKNKMKFSIPGAFQKWENNTLAKEDFNQNEFLKMIVDDYNKGKYESMSEIVEDIKFLIENS